MTGGVFCALIVALVATALWGLTKGLRTLYAGAILCAIALGLAAAFEREAASAARRQDERAERGLVDVVISWTERGVPPTGRVLNFFFEDALDDAGPSGSGPSRMDALRGLVGKLSANSSALPRMGLDLPGEAIDWRTQTLAWAADRESQYDEISRALSAAKKAGAQVQVVARGRGADEVLSSLRRGGGVLPDRMLIVGRALSTGDERLAGDAAYIYATATGAQFAFTAADGAVVRVPGKSVNALLLSAREALLLGVPFRATAPIETDAVEPLAGVWSGKCGSAPFSAEMFVSTLAEVRAAVGADADDGFIASLGDREVSANLIEGLGLSPDRGAATAKSNGNHLTLDFTDGGPEEFSMDMTIDSSGRNMAGRISQGGGAGGPCELVKKSGPTGREPRPQALKDSWTASDKR